MIESRRFWPSVCRALDREDLEHDPRFESPAARSENAEELIAILDEAFASRDLGEWSSRFVEHDLVWGPVHFPMEVIQDPCVLENGYIADYEHPQAGPVKGITCPIQLDRSPMRPPARAPECGEHTEEVLREMGYGPDDIAELRVQKVIPG
jgi:crotonobetainyl-CoA:carnitine CoA-transferase CaiB-like acyl-CoA transferase